VQQRRPCGGSTRPGPATAYATRRAAESTAAADAAQTVQDLLDVRVTVVDDSALICVGGEIDIGTVPRLLDAVDVCIACRARGISIDLSAVTFCDCAGLNAFDQARSQAAAVGGALHLLAPSPPVVRLFSILDAGRSEPPTDGAPLL